MPKVSSCLIKPWLWKILYGMQNYIVCKKHIFVMQARPPQKAQKITKLKNFQKNVLYSLCFFKSIFCLEPIFSSYNFYLEHLFCLMIFTSLLSAVFSFTSVRSTSNSARLFLRLSTSYNKNKLSSC